MSPRFHQLFYRAAFLLLCVVPTAYTIGLIAEQKIATASAAIEGASLTPSAVEELSRILGVEVSLDSAVYQDKVTVLTNVALHDLETGELLASADSAELYFAQDRTLVIEPAGVTLSAGQLPRLAEILYGRVLRELPEGSRIEAGCPTVQLIGGPREETLADVNVSIRHGGEVRSAVATFRPAWKAEEERSTLRISRRTVDSRPLSSISFDTGAGSLPASWFAFVLPKLAKLGDACDLQGTLACDERDAGWETSFHGRLRQVELDRLVLRRLRPYPLGTANLQIDHARWHSGRLAEAEGLIEADALQLNWGTVAEAFVALGLPQQPVLSEQAWRNSLATSEGRLHCRFTLDASGIHLLGKNGIILHDADRPLFGQPPRKLVWTQSLVKFCSQLGVPPLEVLPVESTPVRLHEPE